MGSGLDSLIKAILHKLLSPDPKGSPFATAMYFMYYNFGRIHKTLRVTPAMKAGVRITFGVWKRLRGCLIDNKTGT